MSSQYLYNAGGEGGGKKELPSTLFCVAMLFLKKYFLRGLILVFRPVPVIRRLHVWVCVNPILFLNSENEKKKSHCLTFYCASSSKKKKIENTCCAYEVLYRSPKLCDPTPVDINALYMLYSLRLR